MGDILKFGGQPSSWIAKDGKPAECLGGGDWMASWPAYFQDNDLAVMETLIAVGAGHVEWAYRMIPRSYWRVSADCRDGLARLHDSPCAQEWRPALYYLNAKGVWTASGSQQELQWRLLVNQVETDDHSVSMEESINRARALLKSMLTPLQQIQLVACNAFSVRGALTGNLYWIDLGDGFYILDKKTYQLTVSYCYHPEYWMPDEDVALATKLVLEDPELEPAVLETAKMSIVRGPLKQVTKEMLYARDIERELVA